MMKIKMTLACVATALVLAACGGGSAPAASDKGQISENRTTAFKAMMPDFSSMGKMVKGEETYDVEKFKTHAAAFAANAKKPFEFFQNAPQGNGDALPNIWEKPPEYQAEQDKFLAAVANLNAKAQTGNLEEIKVAYGEVGASCKSCHDTYRRPK